MERAIDRRLRLEEYLDFEARSENRHEYRNGFELALRGSAAMVVIFLQAMRTSLRRAEIA